MFVLMAVVAVLMTLALLAVLYETLPLAGILCWVAALVALKGMVEMQPREFIPVLAFGVAMLANVGLAVDASRRHFRNLQAQDSVAS